MERVLVDIAGQDVRSYRFFLREIKLISWSLHHDRLDLRGGGRMVAAFRELQSESEKRLRRLVLNLDLYHVVSVASIAVLVHDETPGMIHEFLDGGVGVVGARSFQQGFHERFLE
jgi:hypothetical protein